MEADGIGVSFRGADNALGRNGTTPREVELLQEPQRNHRDVTRGVNQPAALERGRRRLATRPQRQEDIRRQVDLHIDPQPVRENGEGQLGHDFNTPGWNTRVTR